MTDPHSGSPRFESLGLASQLMEGIREAGFTHCTPIQAQTLPLALSGKDVAGQAQTGTGKTAAFLVALYHALLTRPAPENRSPTSVRALVVAPTRELAVQIHHDAEILGRHTGFKHAVVYGGVDYEKQRRQLSEGIDVLIGTPGRLIDYYKQHVFDLRHAQVLVLDEADRMFDLGFIADIRYILRRLPHPERRQSMLFSATLSYRVLELAYEHMNNPELVRIEPDKMTVDRVRQIMYYPSMEEKVPLLIGLLRQNEARRTMIFVNTKRMAERLESTLKANGFHAQALSGDVPQNKRLRFLRDFHNGDLAVLIATDVASRGLHIPDVSHVFNFDLPQDAADYVHRIGRTARAGAEGDAISFACEEFAVALPEIEDYIGHKIPSAPIAPDQLAGDVAAGEVSEHRPRPRHQGSGRRGERRQGSGRRGSGHHGSGPHGSGKRSSGHGGSSRHGAGHTGHHGGSGQASGHEGSGHSADHQRDRHQASEPHGSRDTGDHGAAGHQDHGPGERRTEGHGSRGTGHPDSGQSGSGHAEPARHGSSQGAGPHASDDTGSGTPRSGRSGRRRRRRRGSGGPPKDTPETTQ